MNATDNLTSALQVINERKQKYGPNGMAYTRGAIIASVIRDTDTSPFDTISAEIGNKLSRLSQNRLDSMLWVELIADVAMAAQIAAEQRVINGSVSMASFENEIAEQLQAQAVVQGIKHIHED